jgi:hypothetical protein
MLLAEMRNSVPQRELFRFRQTLSLVLHQLLKLALLRVHEAIRVVPGFGCDQHTPTSLWSFRILAQWKQDQAKPTNQPTNQSTSKQTSHESSIHWLPVDFRLSSSDVRAL